VGPDLPAGGVEFEVELRNANYGADMLVTTPPFVISTVHSLNSSPSNSTRSTIRISVLGEDTGRYGVPRGRRCTTGLETEELHGLRPGQTAM
jgi:hypothetical protein